MGFFDQLMNGLNSSPVRQQREADVAQTKQQTADAADQNSRADQKFDMDLFDHMNEMGALPVQSGMVKRTMYDPGNPDLGAPPTNGTLLDKADPARTVSHKTADGRVIQFELPTAEDQRKRQMYQAMQGFSDPAQRQLRSQTNQAESDAQAAKSGGLARGRLDAENADTQANGVAIPSELDSVLPGISTGVNGQPKRVKPSDLDDITRSAGQYANFKSEAATRGQPKAVGEPKEVTDDAGNTTMVTTMSDGTVKETKLAAKGKTAKATGGTTPYQQYQMNRDTNNDAEKRAKDWQDKLDKLQTASESQWAETSSLDDQVKETQRQLDEHGSGILGSGIGASPVLNKQQRYQVAGKLADLQKKASAARSRAVAIDQQKQGVDTVRRSIMGANGIDQTAAPAKPTAAPKTATLGQVNAYAKKYGLDLPAAQKAFEADGITVAK